MSIQFILLIKVITWKSYLVARKALEKIRCRYIWNNKNRSYFQWRQEGSVEAPSVDLCLATDVIWPNVYFSPHIQTFILYLDVVFSLQTVTQTADRRTASAKQPYSDVCDLATLTLVFSMILHVKLSLCLTTIPWRRTGGVEVQLHAFLTSALVVFNDLISINSAIIYSTGLKVDLPPLPGLASTRWKGKFYAFKSHMRA